MILRTMTNAVFCKCFKIVRDKILINNFIRQIFIVKHATVFIYVNI